MLDYLQVWCVIKFKQLRNRIGIKHSNYTKFVILSTGRSGSTLLHTYLNSSVSIYSYGEVGKSLFHKESVLNTLFIPFSKSIKAVGFKLFYDYEDSRLFEDIQFETNIKIIHLYREDALQQFTSLKIAQRTGNWSYNKNEELEEKRLTLDPEEVTAYIDDYNARKNRIAARFKKHEIITISYEQLVANPTLVLTKVQLFLNVEPKPLKSVLKKQNKEGLSSLITNYDEVKQMLEN